MREQIANQILQLAKESTLVQGIIALTVTITICVMYVMGKNVPTELFSVLILILGFYFGSKSQAKIMKG